LEGVSNSEINGRNCEPVCLVVWLTSDAAGAVCAALVGYSEKGLKGSAKARVPRFGWGVKPPNPRLCCHPPPD
jgi:hypothetical protein